MKSSISAFISSSRKALAAWSTVHHHCPLEVSHCAGYCVQTLEGRTSPAVVKARPSAELMVEKRENLSTFSRPTDAPR
jgi:hypothetical protein